MNKMNENISTHWKYNEEILDITLDDVISKDKAIELCGYFYTKAMQHGYGHGLKGEWEDE